MSDLDKAIENFGQFLYYIPWGDRDEEWWKEYHSHDANVKRLMSKYQSSTPTANEAK